MEAVDDPLNEESAAKVGYKSKTILQSKYDKMAAEEVAAQQTHLTDTQRQDLTNMFQSFDELLYGKLGRYPHRKVHLDLMEGSTGLRAVAITLFQSIMNLSSRKS